MKRIFVSDIEKDTEVRDFFLVVKKGIYSTRNNTKYATVRLRDRTGSIEAKIWERVDELAGAFDRNDIVYVESRARQYQDQIQLNVSNIRKETRALSPEEIREFYPEASSGVDKCRETFEAITSGIGNEHLARLFGEMKKRTDLIEKFCLLPASVGVHHVYVGGLLEHSVSVAEMARNAAIAVGADPDLVVAGSLLHDLGKVEEIAFDGGSFRYSDRGRLLGHITLGIMMLEDLISALDGFPGDLADVLRHILLSHHGEEEWGSPKKPMCIEALVIHYIDNLDAKVMGVKEHMSSNMEDERWSQFHKLYESRFFRIPEGESWK